ncbi:hypothetical protein [Helicobacter felis]|uniref:hypothetical protein n=1 Tax=Helicobacter felis TaxID=214 RepID=UPI000CF1B115|nr:hypothetical protein [Helicobacter felis]
MFVFTPDVPKIAREFGNKHAFALHYGLNQTTARLYLFQGKTPTRIRANVLEKLKKMESDGFIAIEYRNGN